MRGSRSYADPTGQRHGSRVVTGDTGDTDGKNRIVRWLCDCGRDGVGTVQQLTRSRGCAGCRRGRPPKVTGAPMHAERPEIAALLYEARQLAPEVWLGDSEESREAVRELAALLGPLSLSEIGVLLGRTRERARQIEEAAMRHLAARLRLVGIGEAGHQDGGAGWTYPEGGP